MQTELRTAAAVPIKLALIKWIGMLLMIVLLWYAALDIISAFTVAPYVTNDGKYECVVVDSLSYCRPR